MYYYNVYPADRSYQGKDTLTYSSQEALSTGQIIVVKLRTKKIMAIVEKVVEKPNFAVTPITSVTNFNKLDKAQMAMLHWMNGYYPGSMGATASLFTPANIASSRTKSPKSASLATIKPTPLPSLTSQQTKTVRDISSSPSRIHILHGDTGTGKTRVYIELAKKSVEQNKSAIILTPEISLTPQMQNSLSAVFDNVHVVHSGLTTAQRRDIWEKVSQSTSPTVLIGPRSALFYPFKSLGVIIVDEFHDSSYRQDHSPRYNSLYVAATAATAYGAKLVLGSATPPVEAYFYAINKGAKVHRLTEKPGSSKPKTVVQVVHISDTQERSAYPFLSNTLISEIGSTIKKGNQVMLFLNKRGSYRHVICQNCGWEAVCERCNSKYTYHKDSHGLICHVCGKSKSVPHTCPACSSSDLLFKSPGTKLVEEAIRKLFPNAKIGRYDKDNKKTETFSENQRDIAAGNVDILIGTQLLTKGHDLPKLGLVGILLAEDSFRFPDYTAEEKSFQLLHQIAGRVGRHDIPGKIIAQTFQPNGAFLEHLSQDEDAWINFYNKELQQRKKYGFPPFRHILLVEVSRKTEHSAEKNIRKIYDQINTQNPSDISILGPAPAFRYMRSGSYHWQIIVMSPSRKLLLELALSLPKSCTFNIDPETLL